MKYWMDEEFIERGSNYPIDLISIGMVCEDGREYYAQSMEYDASKANEWVADHVLSQLVQCDGGTRWHHYMNARVGQRHCMGRKLACDCPWRTRAEIKAEILSFMDPLLYGKPEIWTYYGAYDHVVFCQIFGTMMDLPKAYPMYTMDLKQWCKMIGDPKLPEQSEGEHNALADARHNRVMWEFLDNITIDKILR